MGVNDKHGLAGPSGRASVQAVMDGGTDISDDEDNPDDTAYISQV